VSTQKSPIGLFLDGHYSFDRMLAAQVIVESLALITHDRRLKVCVAPN
jgi:PIN domain nuclease of toxin-antitoxin system